MSNHDDSFQVSTLENQTRIDTNSHVLDLAIRISKYITTNFTASDFFIFGNTRQEEVAKLLDFLKEIQSAHKIEDESISLYIDQAHYRIFENLFRYGQMFGDDIKELEALHDDIWEILEMISSTSK